MLVHKCTLERYWKSCNLLTQTQSSIQRQTRESWSGDHRYPHIPNFEWGNERNKTCCDLSYNFNIHFMAIKNLQILVIDNNLWTLNVKYTIIKLNLYFMVYSIVLKFENIWLSGTLNIIRKPKKSVFSKRKRAITHER